MKKKKHTYSTEMLHSHHEREHETMKKYDNRLMNSVPGAVGVGIKYHPDGGRGTLVIMVDKLRHSNKHMHNKMLGVLKVEVVETGIIRPLAGNTLKYRPVPGGASIGRADGGTGTVSCLVIDIQGRRRIMSNRHVLAKSNLVYGGMSYYGDYGDDIIQPGDVDNGSVITDKLGTLSFTNNIWLGYTQYNYIDAALCAPTDDNQITDSHLDMERVTTYRALTNADIGKPVCISGRTSGYQETTISYFSGSIGVVTGEGTAYYDDQIVTPGISSAGDSGCLLVDKYTGEAVGLLFAGSESVSVYNRISLVFSTYGLSFIASTQQRLTCKYNVDTMDGITWGATSVDAGEISIDWVPQPNTDGLLEWYTPDLGRITYANSVHGKLYLTAGETSISNVLDLGHTGFHVGLSVNKYGSGSGSYTVYIRGSATLFSWQATVPEWEEYVTAFDAAWRYAQIKVVAD
jgi:hypothetical protein